MPILKRPHVIALLSAAALGCTGWFILSRQERGQDNEPGADAAPRPVMKTQVTSRPLAAPARNLREVPNLAREAVERFRADAQERENAAALLAEWASQDSVAAVAFFRALSAEVRESLQADVAAAVLSSDPMQAITLLAEFAPGEQQDGILQQATMELASRDADAAGRLAEMQTDPEIRTMLRSAVLCVQAGHDPAGAAAAALAEFPESPARNRLITEITQRWVQQDAPAAAEFVQTLPDSVRADAADNLIRIWRTTNQDSFQRWAASLPAGELRDAAMTPPHMTP